MKSHTPEQIARWMVAKLERDEFLRQEEVVYEITTRFGDEFTYINQNGNLAIDRRVLAAFRNTTVGTIVWERRERMWRKRDEADEIGRRQN